MIKVDHNFRTDETKHNRLVNKLRPSTCGSYVRSSKKKKQQKASKKAYVVLADRTYFRKNWLRNRATINEARRAENDLITDPLRLKSPHIDSTREWRKTWMNRNEGVVN